MVNTVEALAKFKDFASEYPLATYKKGAVIVPSNYLPNEIYFIHTGKVYQLDASQDGTATVVNIFSKPAFLSIFWLFGSVKNSYYYKAHTNVSVHKIPLHDAQNFMLHNPDVLYVTVQRVVRGLDGFTARLAAQMQGSAEQKVDLELLLEVKRFHSTTKNVILDLNVSELAARTGLARETVSRYVGQLIDDGLIVKNNNKLCIVDVSRLKDSLNK